MAEAGPSNLPLVQPGPLYASVIPNPRLARLLSHLTQIRKLDEDTIERKRERRSAMREREKKRKGGSAEAEDGKAESSKACAGCRKAKTKCLNTFGEVCARCQTTKEACEYPEQRKRGRKANMNIQNHLDEIEEELRTLFGDTALLDRSPPSALPLLAPSQPNLVDGATSTHSALHNPLGVLANAAAASPDNAGASAQAEGSYWNNMYSVKPESDFSMDPVLRGIISEVEVDLLVSLYFRNLRPYFMHLDPFVHTPNFLRMNSPFLTTALCAIASSYHPSTCSLVSRLTAHAHQLAAAVFANGNKSLEIVQAFLILAQWAPAPGGQDRMEDKSWQYQGQAMRLACEIRLDLPMDREVVQMYKVEMKFGEEAVDRLLACRQKSYLLVCLSEIAMSTQSGRADTTSGHRLLRDPILPTSFAGDPINEPFKAYILLNHIFSRSLHHWHGTAKERAGPSAREDFGRTWEQPVEVWKRDWMGKYRVVDIHSINTHIMLILLSLRIPGSDASTQALLRQICELAVQLIVIVQRWYDETDFWAPGGLAYAHNFLIVNIAYGAVLVHKLAILTGAERVVEVAARIERIALILDQIAAGRMNANSFAGYYATQIRSLTSSPQPIPQPAFMPLNTSLQGYDQFDFSFLPFDSGGMGMGGMGPSGANGMGLSDVGWDASIMDPILAFLTADPIDMGGQPGQEWPGDGVWDASVGSGPAVEYRS